jgi:hypothetical protein
MLDLMAQPDKNKLAGDWKCYLDDKTTFELLRLNSDGTGLKCFGQTIDEKDTLFTNHVTALIITSWEVKKEKLILNFKNTISFKINPAYQVQFSSDSTFELTGEQLKLNLFPSYLNRELFARTVAFQRAETIIGPVGSKSATCIVGEKIFSFTPIDSRTHLATYKGFEDLIPHLVGCKSKFELVQQYKDPSYNLSIPTSINKWSFGFGDKLFYISFNSEKDDTSQTSIVIYYDFKNENKDYYFKQIKEGKEKGDIVRFNNIDIYKAINWQGKYEGKIFLNNSIWIAYYTKDKGQEELLQKCITSFKYSQ